jgi:hypothetical protein
MAEEPGQSADLKVGATRNRRNKARMSMKTKDEVKKSRALLTSCARLWL